VPLAARAEVPACVSRRQEQASCYRSGTGLANREKQRFRRGHDMRAADDPQQPAAAASSLLLLYAEGDVSGGVGKVTRAVGAFAP